MHVRCRLSNVSAIVVSLVGAYTVVRASGDAQSQRSRVIFAPPLGALKPEPIQLKVGMFDYVHRPTPACKIRWRRKGRGWGREIREIAP